VVAQVAMAATVLDCRELSTREINRTLRRLTAQGVSEIRLDNPKARHALAVALTGDVRIRFSGPVGWYAAGMNCGPHVVIEGNCGWGVAECMMSGRVEVRGHAGSGTAASIRGGLVYVEGDAGARAGISMKGGMLIVGGSVGYMSGFMMQRGTMIVCGDAAEGLGDSLYEGTIYIAGRVEGYGADAVEKELSDDDRLLLRRALEPFGVGTNLDSFRRVESGRRLWNFSTREPELWRHAL
jgi:glutamate synthase domain-containing protein 3